MKTHLLVGENEVACGKNDDDLPETKEPSKVTCKNCKSTHWFQDLGETKNSSASSKDKNGLLPQELWKQHIQSLRGRNELPRGIR